MKLATGPRDAVTPKSDHLKHKRPTAKTDAFLITAHKRLRWETGKWFTMLTLYEVIENTTFK